MDKNIVNLISLFNPNGEIKCEEKRIINGNATNINDFCNAKYIWTSSWYRESMSNFWVPEEVNMNKDVKDYCKTLTPAEKRAFDKVLSFLIYLDSIQNSNLINLNNYISANEVKLCLNIQNFQESIHSQAYSYMLETLCSPIERNEILYQRKNDKRLLDRNLFISDSYDLFLKNPTKENFIKSLLSNYILEGIYFYSGFMFFYNLARNKKMSGAIEIIKYINRDEEMHLKLFKNIIQEIMKEEPEIFNASFKDELRKMIFEGCKQEIEWGLYVIGNDIQGLNDKMIVDYIMYLGNLRTISLGLKPIFQGHQKEPVSMNWISNFSNTNIIKTDIFGDSASSFNKSNVLKDDL